MTELQIGLIGLCATGVVLVAVYNTWQEYRYRKLGEQILNGQHADVLIDESPSGSSESSKLAEPKSVTPERPVQADLEPKVAARRRTEPIFASDRIEPVIQPEMQPEVEPEATVWSTPVPAPTGEPEAFVTDGILPPPLPVTERIADETKVAKNSAEPFHLLSPTIDYVAAFEAVEPAPAYQILEAQRDVLARIRKPIHWIGYNEITREWEPIIDDGRSEYRRLRIGLQLVDRKGPVGDNELALFHIAMQDLADELMAIADLPPRQPALENAAKLDEFCADVDIQVGINVISQGQAFVGTKLRALAEAAGMVIDADGRFVRCDDEGNVLFVLLNQEQAGFSVDAMKTMSTHGLTFLLDVPRVSHGERVFNQMVDLARRFADVLRGALVDDNHKPLSEGALEPIRRQVGQYQAKMSAQGLPAGGPLTRRLFS